MKRVIAVVMAGMMIIVACKSKKKDAEPADKKEMAGNSAADSASIRKTVTDFYEWYNANYSKFFRYDLYSGLKKEDEPPYTINWEEVVKYQQFIADSVPQLGGQFLQNQKRFLQQCDSAFKVDVADDIPYGFDYDWYTNSQEGTEYLLGDLRNPKADWNIIVNGDDATVRITMTRERGSETEQYTVIGLSMKKEKDKWTIAKIGNE